MTLGDRGSLALCNGEWFYSPAFEVFCADTTGAGDVFHGAFCCAMLEQMPLGAVLEFSNAAAALNCTAIGARGHVPGREEVQALIERSRRHEVQRRSAPDIEDAIASAQLAHSVTPHI